MSARKRKGRNGRMAEKIPFRTVRAAGTEPAFQAGGRFSRFCHSSGRLQAGGRISQTKNCHADASFVEMPFYVLIPDGVNAANPARAMLTFPAHGANKNTVCGVAETPEEAEKIKSTPDECYGREFARRGYMVFCPDPPGYGERAEPMPSEDSSFLPIRAVWPAPVRTWRRLRRRWD